MIAVNEEIYAAIAKSLFKACETENFFNGTVEYETEELYVTLKTTLLIYRQTVCEDDSKYDIIADIVPVWWEVVTVQECGEVDNDFSWTELKKYLF